VWHRGRVIHGSFRVPWRIGIDGPLGVEEAILVRGAQSLALFDLPRCKCLIGHAEHFTAGLPQMPATHSLLQAGA